MKRKEDLMWSLSLYGTAIGAGVLFLPIETGISGIIPIAIIMLFIFPIIFLSHRALCRFVISNRKSNSDITVVADDYFGRKGGIIFNIFYLFAILPIFDLPRQFGTLLMSEKGERNGLQKIPRLWIKQCNYAYQQMQIVKK